MKALGQRELDGVLPRNGDYIMTVLLGKCKDIPPSLIDAISDAFETFIQGSKILNILQ